MKTLNHRPPGWEEVLDRVLIEEVGKMAMKNEVIVIGYFNLPDVYLYLL